MTFDEIPLYKAIHHVYVRTPQPGSDRWVHTDRDKTCIEVRNHIYYISPELHFGQREILDGWLAYRKQPILRLTVEVILTHGERCFYKSRGKGDCSSDVSIDHIIPKSRGGRDVVENLVIVCGFHNSSRNNRSIEEFLAVGNPCVLDTL